ncbi:SGNH/GDSL hydrolase family protein [Nocardioides sp. J54]|uniref:SGNH/GDSL hydrolase family protein n=1 Tax=Nocardioides sp. J54 TaxID=935866 RepID=UPI00048FC410|nr:SGNH/GDSL hydrolase family protein [Nocardioides sp. J54]
MTRHHSRPRLLGVLLALGLVVVATALVWGRAGADANPCARRADRAEQRSRLVTGSGPEVLVIGDSYSVGAGVALRDSWPVRLPGRVRVDGFSGSGFSVGASPCGDVSYGTRAPAALRPATDLVVVEGGLNDTDRPAAELEEGVERLLRRLDGRRVLVVGPPVTPDRPRSHAERVDATLARIAREHQASYLSMLGTELTFLDDDLHPDPAGHRTFGDVVAARVREMLAT